MVSLSLELLLLSAFQPTQETWMVCLIKLCGFPLTGIIASLSLPTYTRNVNGLFNRALWLPPQCNHCFSQSINLPRKREYFYIIYIIPINCTWQPWASILFLSTIPGSLEHLYYSYQLYLAAWSIHIIPINYTWQPGASILFLSTITLTLTPLLFNLINSLIIEINRMISFHFFSV